MLHINQNQLDVIQFEKETIMLSVELLQKKIIKCILIQLPY